MRPDIVESDEVSIQEKFYTWPKSDTSYMKVIRKLPNERYPKGFHLMGSRYHPIGDFDEPGVLLPAESLRIYKTIHGYRVFFTNRYNVDIDSMFDELDALGGDPLYSKYGRRRGYFACRIEPKSEVYGDRYAIAHLLEQTGKPLPEWAHFIKMHDQACNATELDAPLV